MLKRYKLRDYDFKLVLLLLAVSGIGVLLVGSAEKSLQIKQFAGIVMGVVLMLLISLMDYSWILNFYWLMYFANIGMLLFLRVFGANKFGATRWIDLGFFQFQPTELAKLIIILFFAKYLMKHVEELNTFRTIIKALVLLIVPLVLIAIQPDLKNTITVVVIFCGIMYMAGLSYKVIGGISAVVIPLVIVSLIVLTQTDIKIPEKLEYQRTRVMAWLYPENAEYSDDIIQQQNSIIAIGSGQLSGKGLDNNKVSSANKGNFVSQIHNDFIFAVAGEELGFLGSSLIVILLFVISLVCINIGKRAKDLAGSILCSGIGIMVAFQSFINICVATGLFPNTGTPLPFVSYGLTSMVSLYISMGLVLNVGLQGKKNSKGEHYEHRLNRA